MNPVKDLMLAQDRIRELENAIREHRAQKADDRCIEDDDRLYAVLKDSVKCDRRVGSKEEMLKNCARFIDRRCEAGNWPTYAQLEQRITSLRNMVDRLTKYAQHAEYPEGDPAICGEAWTLLRETA
jgi:hypothetical protein